MAEAASGDRQLPKRCFAWPLGCGLIVCVRAQSVLARWENLSKMCVPPGVAVAVYGVGGAYP